MNEFTFQRFAVLLGLFVIANFASVLFGGQSFFMRDFGYFSYPLAQYHRDCFWRGELPLWSPYNSCGMPYLAQWNTLTLYPPALIYLLLPLPWSFNLFCVLHLYAGGLGMYLLAERWSGNRFAACVAGTLFAFSGFTLNCVMWSNNIAALAAMPWVVFLVQRAWQQGGRALLIAALVGAVQMLAGAPEMILLTWIVAAGAWSVDALNRECRPAPSLARFALVAALVAGIASVQLLPLFDLMQASERSRNLPTASWSMPGWGWANFFVPLFHSYRAPIGNYFQPGQDWIASYYTGVCGVVLALAALFKVRNRRVWLLAALLGIGLVLALGDNGFVYPALRRALPQLGFMRFPVKFLILVNFALPLLAAFAVAAIYQARPSLKINWLLAIAGAASLLILGIVWFAQSHPARAENWQTTLWSGLSRIAFLAVITALLGSVTRITRHQTLRIVGALVLFVLFLDGSTHSPKATPSVPSAALQSGFVKLDPPTASSGHRALLIRPAHDEIYATMISNPLQDFLLHRQALFGNCNLIDRVPTADGFFSLYVREQREVWSQLWFHQTNYVQSPLLDFLGVTHVNSAAIFEWTNRPHALPLATIGQRPVFADAGTTLDALISPDFEPHRTVYLPVEAKGTVQATNVVAAEILSIRHTAHRIELKVTAPSDTVLVLAQSFYGPWRAMTDGQPTSLLRANHAFQAVPVAAGTHEIILEYRDKAFRSGAFVALLSLALMAGLWIGKPHWL